MTLIRHRAGLTALLLMGSLVLLGPQAVPGWAAEYGRLTGTVSDPHGTPLIGATVLLTGPLSPTTQQLEASVERVITDAHGRFTMDHLVPGWYSLKVTSPTRVPVLRNGIRIEGGETSAEKVVLTDIFAPVHVQLPTDSVSSWGEDWKWVLRTSAATRPILRYNNTIAQAGTLPSPTPPSQRLIGLAPGAAGRDPLSGDPGLGSVLAYLRPLSDDADLLVAGSMAPNGVEASTVATVFRKHLVRGDPQELTVVVHQMNLSDGAPVVAGNLLASLAHAQGAMISYVRLHRLTSRLTLTTGMEVDYLNAAQGALTVQPNLKLQYQASPVTELAFRYGVGRPEESDTLLERVGTLSAFPRVTLRNFRPELEQLNHAEVSAQRQVSRRSRVQLAAYHDALRNAATWGSGGLASSGWLVGNVLPNPAAGEGIILNLGDYHASGVRAAYAQTFGNHLEAVLDATVGDALAAKPPATPGQQATLSSYLQDKRSSSVAGKVTAQVPGARTLLTTSYGWSQSGRVTAVDPYGQAYFQLQPYLGFQIRQPLPTIAFLPAHIEALADFRNLLAQGYVPLSLPGEKPVLLSSSYRSFRGGFSVQF